MGKNGDMEKVYFLTVAVILQFMACNKNRNDNMAGLTSTGDTIVTNMPGVYTDLNTGSIVKLYKDEETGYVLNALTGEPIDLYVDMRSGDTIYGRTGTVVNSALSRTPAGLYCLDERKIKWVNDEMTVVAHTPDTLVAGNNTPADTAAGLDSLAYGSISGLASANRGHIGVTQ